MEYKFIASDQKTGKRVVDVATADTVASLVNRLKTEGLIPLKIFEANPRENRIRVKSFLGRGRVRGKELAIFTRQLSATLRAGLLLTDALDTISTDLDNDYLHRVIKKVRDDIQAGEDLSTSLGKHRKIFPITYVSIVRSGEATGQLAKTMASLAAYLESIERLKQKVINGVRYPLLVFGFAVFVVLVIVLFLIPKFAGIFDQFNAELPLLTRMVVNTSNFTLHNLPLILMVIFAAIMIYIFCLRFEAFRYAVDRQKIRVPLIGKDVIHKALIARFCRTFGFLLKGGVGLSTALEICSNVVDHLPMRDAIERLRDRVVAGASISEEMRKIKIFPLLVSKMVSVGERTGQLDDMFERTADYYDEELDATLENLTTILEPALIISVGGIVLLVVLALYLPIFQMSTVIK